MFQVYKFWTEHKPDPKDPDKVIDEDWIEYGPYGQGDWSRATERVSAFADTAPRPPVGNMTKQEKERYDKWDFIRPLYEAWKTGPDQGWRANQKTALAGPHPDDPPNNDYTDEWPEPEKAKRKK